MATVYSSSSSRTLFSLLCSFSLSLGGAAELWAFCFLCSSLTSCLRRATRRASRVLPISPRAYGSVLSRSSLRLSRRRLFRCRFFSSFAFRSACRGVKSAGGALTARTHQVCLVLSPAFLAWMVLSRVGWTGFRRSQLVSRRQILRAKQRPLQKSS